MKMLRTTSILGTLLLFGAAGCADLEVPNLNAPDAKRALESAGDIESLIAGGYKNWYIANGVYDGISMALGNMSFEYGSSAANSGAVEYSAFPRPLIVNSPTATFYPNFALPYRYAYRSIYAVASGIAALEDPELAAALDKLEGSSAVRSRAYGKFVLGLSHATLAVLYDQGFIVDETTQLVDASGVFLPQPVVGYQEMMEAALGYFDEAIQLASGADFTIPDTWMTTSVSSADLVKIAHSMKARYRAAVARTPDERAQVNWQAVLDDIAAGVDDTYWTNLEFVYNNWYSNHSHLYTSQPGSWAYTMYWIEGMADQDGQYQEWLSIPIAERHPDLPSGPFLINTPDLRFPQGQTLAEQAANPGKYYKIPVNSAGQPSLNSQWARPDRGTWRWSYYDDANSRPHVAWLYGFNDLIPELSIEQQRLLAAEAHYRLGNRDAAANLINVTRTANGLNATDAAGTNTSCVPKLPNGECGGLFEMLKWEKRLEGKLLGIFQAEGYFDSRGWGDLYNGTALHFPIPGQELATLQMPNYAFGGVGGEGASTGSSYNYPYEK